MQIKKTISQIALGLAVIGLGASASAFTDGESVPTQGTRYWGNDETTGQYIELPGEPDVDSSCDIATTPPCVVQSENQELNSTLSYSDATNPANQVEPHPDSNNGFFNP